MDKMFLSILVPTTIGGLALFGVVVGSPDLGWISAAVVATVWIDDKFRQVNRRIDKLPCMRGKICGYSLNDKETTTF
jgi:hypothetical protein